MVGVGRCKVEWCRVIIIYIEYHRLTKEMKVESECGVKKSLCVAVDIYRHMLEAYNTDSPHAYLQQVCVLC